MSGYIAGYNNEWLIYSWQYIICLFMWSHPFFSESCFLATNIWKKIREKIRSEKKWGVGLCGVGRGGGSMKQDTMSYLSWMYHCIVLMSRTEAVLPSSQSNTYCCCCCCCCCLVWVVCLFFFFFAKLIVKLPFVLSFKCFYVYYLLWTMLWRVAFFMFLRTSIGLHNISLPLL